MFSKECTLGMKINIFLVLCSNNIALHRAFQFDEKSSIREVKPVPCVWNISKCIMPFIHIIHDFGNDHLSNYSKIVIPQD